MKYFFIIIISSFLYLSNTFTIHINNHYSNIAGNIFDVNNLLLYDRDIAFKNINYYNENKSLIFNLKHKNNIKYLLKDKYNYIISFDIHKYKYKIFLKSKPILYNYTEIDVDIRHDRNLILNNNHYRRINNVIYTYIYDNIIIKNNKDYLSIDLFKYFNNY